MDHARGWGHRAAGSCLTFSELDRGLGSCAHLPRLRSVSRCLGWQGCVSLPLCVRLASRGVWAAVPGLPSLRVGYTEPGPSPSPD